MLRAILVDDEQLILDELQEILRATPNVMVIGTYTNPLDALRALEESKPDCAFLDIEMQEMNGVELAERMASAQPNLEVVFVTAYNNYAYQAFDLNAADYLLKPIRPERIEKTLEKLCKKLEREQGMQSLGRQSEKAPACLVKCFGSFELLVDGNSVRWTRTKSKEFLAFMLQNEGKWVTKYRLCEELRPELRPDQALASLQMSVYTLRKNLREAGCTQIEIKYADDRYIVKLGALDWDLRRFEEGLGAFYRKVHQRRHKKPLTLIRASILRGKTGPGQIFIEKAISANTRGL